jgi:hypothetical protein
MRHLTGSKRQPTMEERVARQVAQTPDATNAAIASRLGVSESTVRRYRLGAFVHLTAEMVRAALCAIDLPGLMNPTDITFRAPGICRDSQGWRAWVELPGGGRGRAPWRPGGGPAPAGGARAVYH